MKRKLLTTLLSIPLATTCLTSVVACSNKKTTSEVVNTTTPVETINPSPVKPLDATESHVVSFRAQPGLEKEISFVGRTDVKVNDGDFFASVVAPSAYKNGYPVIYWEDAKGNKVSGKTTITSDLTVYPHFDDIQIKNCICLSAIENSTISINHYGDSNPTIQYSNDGRTWQDYHESFITLESGHSVYFKGNNPQGFSKSDSIYTSFSIGGAVSLIGNVMTLIDDGQGTRDDIPCPYCFYRLFENCSGIVSISSNLLPATKLKEYSYAYMFDDCTNLTDFPKSLMQTESLYYDEEYNGTMCCHGMFANCTGLKNIPAGLLNAKTLSKYCYYNMFENCTGLTKLESGVLPATTLATGCYLNMFGGCKHISTVDGNLLPATTLADSCYYEMFSGCTGLNDLSKLILPAETLAANCYDQMFYNCTELTYAPQMKGRVLADSSYSSMYYNCSKLIDVDPFPEGQTYTLANSCCRYMFKYCSSLTQMPSMPSAETELKPYCFCEMFRDCSKLEEVTGLQHTKIADHCYEYMFLNCSSIASAMTTLPATTLKPSCYVGMFQNCTQLVAAPELLAETPTQSCYASMFYGCTGLKKAKIGITQFVSTATGCMSTMFKGCGNLILKSGDGQPEGYELCIAIPEYTGLETIGDFCNEMFSSVGSGTAEPTPATPSFGTKYWYRV